MANKAKQPNKRNSSKRPARRTAADGRDESPDDPVHDSPAPAATVDTTSGKLTSANRAFRALFHLARHDVPGFDLLTLLAPGDLLSTPGQLVSLGSGALEFWQGRSSWHPANGGAALDVRYWVRPAEPPPAGAAIVTCLPIDRASRNINDQRNADNSHDIDNRRGTDKRSTRVGRAGSERSDDAVPLVAIGVTDHQWRITEISTASASMPGCDRAHVLGAPLTRLFHPDDAPDVVATTARITPTRAATTTEVRVGDEVDGWRPARLVVSPVCGHDPPRLAFTVQPAPMAGWIPLTNKPGEVFRRIVAGESVAETARHMFISPSTVRNHLATIFRAYDVHSQRELMRKLRASTDG